MTPQRALHELFERIGIAQGISVLLTSDELSHWHNDTVVLMKSHGLLTRAQPASSAICPGCENECVMPVHTPPNKARRPDSFIVCDKRSDINRVPVSTKRLTQCI